jgi:cell wall-associated NlpC family hydrolase
MISGADVATQALKYKGVPYVWGGYLPSGWDCSGFVGYVLGHDFGFTLPLGLHWNRGFHGPVALNYKTWTKARTVPTASPGVLCCWNTHVGFAISSTRMVSALDPRFGTAITRIDQTGPPGETLSLREINLVSLSGDGPPGKTSGCPVAAVMLPYLIVKGALHARREHRTAEPAD